MREIFYRLQYEMALPMTYSECPPVETASAQEAPPVLAAI
jgi:hypothetical protein